MIDFERLIKSCEAYILEGQTDGVRQLLSSLEFKRVPRAHKLALAKISRRAGLLSLGLRLLSPLFVQSKSDQDPAASHEETAEYAVLLQRSGILPEAWARLSTVDTKQVPQALLYRAFVAFARWEFHQAIAILETYLASDISPHDRTVGEINLAFALIETQKYSEAQIVLDGLKSSSSPQTQSTAHALLGQIQIERGNFALAREAFATAQNLVSGRQSNDQFFATKSMLILDGLENRDGEAFDKLRQIAKARRAWETVREADFYELRTRFNRAQFLHLYFGSPLEGFRERLRAEIAPAPEQQIYVLGDKKTPRLDLRTGFVDDKPMLKPGRKCHEILEVLLQDFYRPLRVTDLYSKLFPDEHYNVDSSPHRIHQLILRSRQTLREAAIPVEIVEVDGFYSAQITGAFSFRIPLTRRPASLVQLHLEKLKTVFQNGESFSTKTAKSVLGLSSSGIHRLIHRGIDEGLIERDRNSDGSFIYRIAG